MLAVILIYDLICSQIIEYLNNWDSTEPKYNVKIHLFSHFYTTTKAGMAVHIFFTAIDNHVTVLGFRSGDDSQHSRQSVNKLG